MSDVPPVPPVNSSSPAALSPDKLRGIQSALTRYRVMAWVTGVVLAVMTISLIAFTVLGVAKEDRPGWYSIGWISHGWLFVVYLITAVDLATRVRWRPLRTLMMMAAGTIPFASFFAEHWANRDVRSRFPVTAAPSA